MRPRPTPARLQPRRVYTHDHVAEAGEGWTSCICGAVCDRDERGRIQDFSATPSDADDRARREGRP